MSPRQAEAWGLAQVLNAKVVSSMTCEKYAPDPAQAASPADGIDSGNRESKAKSEA